MFSGNLLNSTEQLKTEFQAASKEFLSLLEEFIDSYAANKGNMPLSSWLEMELRNHLPEKSTSEINLISNEILSGLKTDQEKKESLEREIQDGVSKEEWFSNELKKNTALMTPLQTYEYLSIINNAVSDTQKNLLNAVNVPFSEKDKNINPAEFNEFSENYMINNISEKIKNTAAASSLLNGTNYDFVDKFFKDKNGNKTSDTSKIIEDEINSSNCLGIKAAAAGASKVGAERDYIPKILSTIPNKAYADIAHVAIEKAKNAMSIGMGELSSFEGMEAEERIYLSVIIGEIGGAKGAALGAYLGSTFGPAGTVIGGIIGGVTGYMAGVRITRELIKGIQEIRRSAITKVASFISGSAKALTEALKNISGKIFDFMPAYSL